MKKTIIAGFILIAFLSTASAQKGTVYEDFEDGLDDVWFQSNIEPVNFEVTDINTINGDQSGYYNVSNNYSYSLANIENVNSNGAYRLSYKFKYNNYTNDSADFSTSIGQNVDGEYRIFSGLQENNGYLNVTHSTKTDGNDAIIPESGITVQLNQDDVYRVVYNDINLEENTVNLEVYRNDNLEDSTKVSYNETKGGDINKIDYVGVKTSPDYKAYQNLVEHEYVELTDIEVANDKNSYQQGEVVTYNSESDNVNFYYTINNTYLRNEYNFEKFNIWHTLSRQSDPAYNRNCTSCEVGDYFASDEWANTNYESGINESNTNPQVTYYSSNDTYSVRLPTDIETMKGNNLGNPYNWRDGYFSTWFNVELLDENGDTIQYVDPPQESRYELRTLTDEELLLDDFTIISAGKGWITTVNDTTESHETFKVDLNLKGDVESLELRDENGTVVDSVSSTEYGSMETVTLSAGDWESSSYNLYVESQDSGGVTVYSYQSYGEDMVTDSGLTTLILSAGFALLLLMSVINKLGSFRVGRRE